MKLMLILFFALFIHPVFAHVYSDIPEQRRELSVEESQRLLRYGNSKAGCSATALTPDLIITAAHCLFLNEGYFEADPTKRFIAQNMSPVEVSSLLANDVVIIKIKWLSGVPKKLRFVREIAMNREELYFAADIPESKVFTLGYPADRAKQATYSWGYLRGEKNYPQAFETIDPFTQKLAAASAYLTFNASATNGNSGGALYTEGFKLIGIVSNGNQPSGPTLHTSQEADYWNQAASLYFLYPQFKTLQKLFPNGVNLNVTEDGEWTGEWNSYNTLSTPLTSLK